MPARISSFAKDATRVLLVDFIEQRLKCDPVARRIFRMEEKAALHLDAHAEEQILIGHVQAITGEANQIFRRFSGAGYGIDGEIEFKDNDGEPSGKKIYVQLKNGNSHRRSRRDGRDFFDVTDDRRIEYRISQPVDVYLVIRQTDERTGEPTIRWMKVTCYLKNRATKKAARSSSRASF